MGVIVKLDNVSKSFDGVNYIIKNLSLDVYEGEFLTLLGSSGCGKTTILRMISGLEHVTDGSVYIDNVNVTEVDPTKREVNTIFQNFALFPHMSVWENVAFGLKMKKVNKDEINDRVSKALKVVKLVGFEDRLPSQLSGGQQQRVAIARGIVMNPKVLLLDESLCSLDLKLKRKMQVELKKIQKKLGITFIYVTHDQDEALTMSDRIAIIDKGVIQQIDSPDVVYNNPRTTFVADFIGESNILDGEIKTIKDGFMHIEANDRDYLIQADDTDKIHDKIHLLIRPENIKVSLNELKDSVRGVVRDFVYDGSMCKLVVIGNDDFKYKVNTQGNVKIKEGDVVYLKIENSVVVPIRSRKNEKR